MKSFLLKNIYRKKITQSKGFSLIELMLVISVLVILSSIGVGSYINYAKSVEINSVTQALVFDLKQAQSKAMTGEGGLKWGIHAVNGVKDYYEIFSTPTDYSSASKVIISTNYLQSNVNFTDPVSDSTKDIIFNKISGSTTGASLIVNSQNITRMVNVSSIGNIVLVNPVAQLLVVAGGGGGGSSAYGSGGGGGGGGGGLYYNLSYLLNVGDYNVVVGIGGAPGTIGLTQAGQKGGDSSFGSVSVSGGGAGAGASTGNGSAGGSGGGAGYNGYANIRYGGSSISGQGNIGGNTDNLSSAGGAGGGGAGGIGGNNKPSHVGGDGGAGLAYSITGILVTYAKGGNGGRNSCIDSPLNTGKGGDAAYGDASYGAIGLVHAGSSGIVVVSYPATSGIKATGGTITEVGGNIIHTFISNGTFSVTPF
jgi:prepilin-type N-terminal cleavage/methylation domain-containing protein